MAKKLKKGMKGPSAQYVTRAVALKRTQLRLAEFRRLCILKGIYPREPKRKLRGPQATYYHAKDIAFLNKDPLMPQFRAMKAHDKKIKKALGRKELPRARRLNTTKPTYTLNHLIKERYPTLLDAVRDLDDPLSTLALFASLPSDDKKGIAQKALTDSTTFIDQFHFLVGEKRLLKKAFASIKGYYFQAEILGHGVTWLVPHQYTQELPFEVDFRVMLTFQEFYACLVKFVNFKLFALNDLTYPPTVDLKKRRMGARHLALTAMTVTGDRTDTTNENNNDLDDDGDQEMTASRDVDDEKSLNDEKNNSNRGISSTSSPNTRIFDGLTVYISREVPLGPLSIVLRSGGATIGWDNESSPIDMEDPSITHQLVDRTTDQLESLYDTWQYLPPRTYVQPQWALDCLNNNCILPTDPYRPGVQPPPHLSPFVDDIKEGYIPKQREILNSIVAEKRQAERNTGVKNAQSKSSANDDDDNDDDDEVDAQIQNIALAEKYHREIERERQGQWFSHELSHHMSDKQKDKQGALSSSSTTRRTEIGDELFGGERAEVTNSKAARKMKRDKEEMERRTALLSNRKRKLKQRLDEEQNKTVRRAQKLEEKRKQKEAAAGDS